MLLIDIHTHSCATSSVGISIKNYHEFFSSISENEICTAGLHPLYISAHNAEEAFNSLKKNALKKSVVAIGECGLDSLCGTDLELQQKYFRIQLMLAQELNKPIILHCVRMHELVLHIIQELKITVPVVFHGFNKKWKIAEKIIKRNHYLSFGSALFTNSSIASVFQLSPLNSVFLETDNSDISIAALYEKAAAIKNITVENLSDKIYENAVRFFGARIFVT